MIPILYDKTGNVKIGELKECIECFVEEERNGLFELSLIYPITDTLFNYLEDDNIIVADANDTLKNQQFRIYNTRKLMANKVEVYARHISFDLAYDHLQSIDIDNQSCEYALNTIFRNSQFSTHYRGYSDIINAQNFKVSMKNCLNAIAGSEGSIIDTYGTGAEILRDNTNIHVLNSRGHDNDVTIEYRKNLTGFELDEDKTDLETRCAGYFKYTDEETNEEIIIMSDWIDSDNISLFSHPYINPDGPRDYTDKFEEGVIPTKEQLNELCKKEFTKNKRHIPKVNYKIEFIPLSKCVGYEGLEDKISLCDTVTIIDSRYNVNTKVKTIRTVYDVLRDRYESVELGEPRTTLGDIIAGSSDGQDGEQGPPGPQGPPGQDGNIGDFPNSLPSTPVLSAKLYGFSTIELSWTFDNKVYYSYELYASKIKDFTPNTFDIIHAGQSSSFLFQAKPNETWYFRVCCINSHGNRTDFSNQVAVTTTKVSDLSNYVDNMAINEALIGTLSLDRGWFGQLRGNYIDAKQLSVTDGSGNRTLDIDSFGNVRIKATEFVLEGKTINPNIVEKIEESVKNVDVQYYLSTSKDYLHGGSWSTTAPAWEQGKYMWSRTVTTYTSGEVKYSQATCIAGAKGDKGDAGANGANGSNGIGVSNIIEQYALSNSKVTAPSTWSTTFPEWSSGYYVWTRSKITYTDGSVSYTTPYCDSSWEQVMDVANKKLSPIQNDVFNALTNNGQEQGIYLKDGKLYLNGEYLNLSKAFTVGISGKYIKIEDVEYSVYNNAKKVISMGLRDLSYTNGTVTDDTPCIYLGADGMNSNGGTSYTGKTGRYYGMIQAFNHLNSIDSSYTGYYQVPYLNFRFHTNGTTSSGYPTASNFRMFANGDIMAAPTRSFLIKTNYKDGSLAGNGMTEYEIAKFYSSASENYGSAMQIQAVVNVNNAKGLQLYDSYYAGGAGENINGTKYVAAVQVKCGQYTDNTIMRTFRPYADGTVALGSSSYKWYKIWSTTGTIQTSDRRAKENIEYISNTKNLRTISDGKYTLNDLYEFVKNIPFATYNLKETGEKSIGFIMQDIIQDDIGKDLILDSDCNKVEKGMESKEPPLMGYNQGNYVNILAIALQEAMNKIEALERRLEHE